MRQVSGMSRARPITRSYYEFFAGGGMARAGLGSNWTCLFANDFNEMKAAAYRENWGGEDLLVEDVNLISSNQLPAEADLAWALFPCQDLSLAGNYEGIGRRDAAEQTRSGTFWAFWRLMKALGKEGRAPRMVMLENVFGVLTSNGGQDFAAISSAFSGAGYRFGAMVIDAKLFLPQSRPRVFFLAIRRDVEIPVGVSVETPSARWHPDALRAAVSSMSKAAWEKWLWWDLPLPKKPVASFSDLIEENPDSTPWHTASETCRLISLMSPRNLAKLDLILGIGVIDHHSSNTNDQGAGRTGDFDVGDVSIHVSTSPTEALIRKCQENINAARRPVIVTTSRGSVLAEGLAGNARIADRLDVIEFEQFLATNIYEMGQFAPDQRRVKIEELVERYNSIVDAHETDPSLRIEIAQGR